MDNPVASTPKKPGSIRAIFEYQDHILDYDGSLTVWNENDGTTKSFTPDAVFALVTFLHFPGVRPLIERAYLERQHQVTIEELMHSPLATRNRRNGTRNSKE
jgi:hypothetical protein